MRVATMAVQDLKTDAIDAIRADVQLAAARGSVGILGLGLCAKLMRLRGKLDDMGRLVSAADVRTDEDRMLLGEIARSHQTLADLLSDARDRIAAKPPPFFRFAIVHLFDGLVVQAEDMAETAALGASAEFAALVKEDLQSDQAG